MAPQLGIKRTIPLAVSAPFHCALMKPAQESMIPFLTDQEFHQPKMPLVSNVDAKIIQTGEQARDALIRQIPTRSGGGKAWRQSSKKGSRRLSKSDRQGAHWNDEENLTRWFSVSMWKAWRTTNNSAQNTNRDALTIIGRAGVPARPWARWNEPGGQGRPPPSHH